MPAYIVFTRTKTIDQKELDEYWAGIRATMKGHPMEVLVAYGKHEVLKGDPVEGIVIAKFPNVRRRVHVNPAVQADDGIIATPVNRNFDTAG